MRNASEQMARLLNELLELSRIGRRSNPPVEVILGEVAREAMALVAGRIVERGVTVEVATESLILRGDRPRFVEVPRNLLDNAVKVIGDQTDPRVADRCRCLAGGSGFLRPRQRPGH
jgi:signal transduction histidine kinase